MADATLQHDAVQHGLPGAYEAPLFGAYSKKIGMWLFLVSDSLTFGALLFAFSYNRIYTGLADAISRAEHCERHDHDGVPAVEFADHGAWRSLRRSAAIEAWTRNWLLATMAFGTAFIVLHGMEWSKLIEEGLTLPMFPKPRPRGGRGDGGYFEEHAAVPCYFLWAYRDAHAACDDWRDLSGRGRVSKMVPPGAGRPLAGGIFR